jgi:hypothetical protein
MKAVIFCETSAPTNPATHIAEYLNRQLTAVEERRFAYNEDLNAGW